MPPMFRLRPFALLLMLSALAAAALGAQRQRFGFGAGTYAQKEKPRTEFAIARWYSSGWTSDGWNHDYPDAEEHILQIIDEVSAIDANRLSYQVVDLASPEIFKYPFAYVSHPGELRPSDEEIENLRQYVERGGFLMLDDFGGQGQGAWEMEGFQDLIHRAFPGRDMYRLNDDHPLLALHYQIDGLN